MENSSSLQLLPALVKTTIVRHILSTFPSCTFSVSATTRQKREGEIDGRHYFFLSTDDFQEKIEAGDFAEYEEVYSGLLYGSLKSELQGIWDRGNHVVFDVDVKGAMRLKKKYPDNSISIFVQPPSIKVLEERLMNRKTETPESLKERIDKVNEEMKFGTRFDIVLMNDILETALIEAEMIVKAFIFE